MPAISVIVPIYNVSAYLRECIDSILRQSFTAIEVILINDGSTDDSGEICQSYTDKRIKYIHQDNKGLSGARNTGLGVATGKYICFIDSDDYVSVDYCKTMYDIAEKEKSDVVMCNIKAVDEHGGFLYYPNENLIPCVVNLDENSFRPFVYKYFTGARNTMAACNKLYLRSFIERNALCFNENIQFVEDTPFCYEVLCCASIYAVTNEALYYYRLRNTSLTRTSCNVDYVSDAFKLIYNDMEKSFLKHNKEHLLFQMEPVLFTRILQMEFFFFRQKLGDERLCCKAILPNIEGRENLLWRAVFGRELIYYSSVLEKGKAFLSSMRSFAATCALGYYPMVWRQISYSKGMLGK